jgi:hypothetical protein
LSALTSLLMAVWMAVSGDVVGRRICIHLCNLRRCGDAIASRNRTFLHRIFRVGQVLYQQTIALTAYAICVLLDTSLAIM